MACSSSKLQLSNFACTSDALAVQPTLSAQHTHDLLPSQRITPLALSGGLALCPSPVGPRTKMPRPPVDLSQYAASSLDSCSDRVLAPC
jgi:hypothetical protein